MVVGAVGLTVMGLWTDPTGLLIGTVIYGSGVAFMFPALGLLVVSAVPASERGAALGTFTVFLDLAFGLGPVTIGAVVATLGYGEAFLVGAAVALGGAALLLLATRPAPESC